MKFNHKWSQDGMWWFSDRDKLDEQNDILVGFIRSRYTQYPDIKVFQIILLRYRCSFGWKTKSKL